MTANSKTSELIIASLGQLSTHWLQNMHLLKSNCGRRFPSTSTIVIAPAGQSRAQTLQAEPAIGFTSKLNSGLPSEIMLQQEMLYCGWPRKFSESSGFTKGYFVVAGLVNICDTVRLMIVVTACMRSIFTSPRGLPMLLRLMLQVVKVLLRVTLFSSSSLILGQGVVLQILLSSIR